MNHLISKSGLKPRKQGFRDFSSKKYKKHFGGPVFVPRGDSYDLTPSWVPILNQIDLDICTAESLATGKSVVEGYPIDPLWQFKETKKKEGRYDTYGADPVDAINAMRGGALKAELSPFKVGVQDRSTFANWNNWPANLDESAKTNPSGAWFRPDGQKDLFDSIREDLQTYGTKAIVVLDLYWQPHWTNALGGVINYDGIYDEINPHQVYVRVAQKVINGNPYLVIQNSYGDGVGDKGLFYFDRKTVNMFNRYAGGAKVLLDADPAEVKKATWNVLQKIADFLVKLLQQVNKPPIPTPQIIQPDQSIPAPVKPIEEKSMSKLYDLAKSLIGTDASPKDIAQDGVGCAESVSTIVNKLLPNFPVVTGTWSLWDLLRTRHEFSAVSEDESRAGDIIICVTGTGKGTIPNGHTGIIAGDGIMSNDSKTGIWKVNFTRESWNDYYVTKGKYPVYYYRLNV